MILNSTNSALSVKKISPMEKSPAKRVAKKKNYLVGRTIFHK
jgi:hypothetical protein